MTADINVTVLLASDGGSIEAGHGGLVQQAARTASSSYRCIMTSVFRSPGYGQLLSLPASARENITFG